MSNSQSQILSIYLDATTAKSISSGGDPLNLQFCLDFKKKEYIFVETVIYKNSTDVWNKTLTIPLNNLNDESNLYVEARDVKSTSNSVIGFAAIPIDQIIATDGAKMNGLFEIYNTRGKSTGVLGLKLAITDSSNSITPEFNGESIYGASYVQDGHCATLPPTELASSKE